MKRILIAALLFSVAPSVSADMFQPSHNCTKPFKPYQFNNQWEIDSFNDDVRRYRQCISDFIEEQELAVQVHQLAAEEAIDDWNIFVRLELN